jgi:site-specific recombinase XerD
VLYSEVFADYLNDLLHGRGLSKATHTTYRHWLQTFGAWAASGPGAPDQYQDVLTADLIRRWVYHLNGEGKSPASIRVALNAVRGLCAFLVERNALVQDPAFGIRPPKKKAQQRYTATDGEVDDLFAICDRIAIHNPRRGALARAMISSIVFVGLRASEVCALRLGDVRPDAGTLVVAQGKGAKARTLYPPQEFWDAYERWMVERAEMKPKHDYLFAQAVHKRVAYEGLRQLVAEVRAMSASPNAHKITCHGLRHNFATFMHRNGATVNQVQAALGHQSTQTTFIYLHLNEGDTQAMRELASRRPNAARQTPSEAAPQAAPAVARREERGEARRRRTRSDHALQRRRVGAV